MHDVICVWHLPLPLRDTYSKITGHSHAVMTQPPDPRAGTTSPRFSRLEPPLHGTEPQVHRDADAEMTSYVSGRTFSPTQLLCLKLRCG